MLKKAINTSWFSVFVYVNSLLIVITITTHHLLEYPYIKTFINRPFSLVHEMSFATWWSGICLLIIALHLFESFLSTNSALRYSWLFLSLIFLGFSFDEIGSIHERLSWIENWAGIKPLCIMVTTMLGISVAAICINRQTRISGLLILTGFVGFAGVVLMEILEHSVSWPGWAGGARAGLEEGVELFGAFAILAGVVLQKGRIGELSLLKILPEPIKIKGMTPIIVTGLILQLISSYFLPLYFDLTTQGNPLVWFPMVIFFLLFCQASWNWSHSTNSTGDRWGYAAILFLLCSANTNYPLLRIIPKILRVFTLEQVQMLFYLLAGVLLLTCTRSLFDEELTAYFSEDQALKYK